MAVRNYMSYEKDFRAAIQLPLQDCIEAIESINSTVAKVKGKNISLSEYEKLQKCIEQAYQKAHHIEQSACEQVDRINSESQALISEKLKLKSDITSKENELKSLQIKLRTLELEMRSHKERIAEASVKLDKAKDEVRAAEQQQKYAERQMTISLFTMLIPVFGTIAGGIAAVCHAVSCNDAIEKQRVAKEMASEYRKTIADHEKNMEACSQKIQQIQQEIVAIKKSLEVVTDKLEMASSATKELTTVQKKLQDCTAYLSELSGKVECMKVMNSGSINLDSLNNTVQEIIAHLKLRNRNKELLNVQLKKGNAIGDMD